jgi:hypothetical protein
MIEGYDTMKTLQEQTKQPPHISIIHRRPVIYKAPQLNDATNALLLNYQGDTAILHDPSTSEEEIVAKVDQISWDDINIDAVTRYAAKETLGSMMLLKTDTEITELSEYLAFEDNDFYYYMPNTRTEALLDISLGPGAAKKFGLRNLAGAHEITTMKSMGYHYSWVVDEEEIAFFGLFNNASCWTLSYSDPQYAAITDTDHTVAHEIAFPLLVLAQVSNLEYQITFGGEYLDTPVIDIAYFFVYESLGKDSRAIPING